MSGIRRKGLLGGPWLVVNGVISRAKRVVNMVWALISPF